MRHRCKHVCARVYTVRGTCLADTFPYTGTQSLPFMPDPSQLHSTLGSTAAVVTEGNFTGASLQADGREADAAVGDGRSESDDSDGDPAHKFAAKLRARLISDKSSGSPRVDGQMQDKQGLQGLRQDWKNGGGALANADPGVGGGGKAGGDGEEIVEETEEEVDETDAEQEGQGGHPRLRDLPFKSGQQSACAVVKNSRRVNIDGEDVAAERAQMARSRACPPPSSPPSRAPRTCMAPSVTSSLPRRRGCRGRPGEGSKGTMHGWGEVETKSESPGGSMCGLARADGAGSVRKRRRAAACVEALDSGAVSEAAACAKAGGGETERKWHDAGAAVTVQGADESQADAMQLTGRMAGQRSRRAGRDETPERERKVSAVGGGTARGCRVGGRGWAGRGGCDGGMPRLRRRERERDDGRAAGAHAGATGIARRTRSATPHHAHPKAPARHGSSRWRQPILGQQVLLFPAFCDGATSMADKALSCTGASALSLAHNTTRTRPRAHACT